MEQDISLLSPLWNPPKMWKGSTVFIIGGGSSLKGFDFSVLEGQRIIGCNDAYQLGDMVDICCFGDVSWFDKHNKDLVSYPDGTTRPGLANFSGLKVTNVSEQIFDQSVNRCHREWQEISFDKPYTLGWYSCTGNLAICLAVHLGAKKIILLGFDNECIKGQSNWHPNLVDGDNQPAEIYTKFAKHSDLLKKDLLAAGIDVEIINANAESKLKTWKTLSLEKVLVSEGIVSEGYLKKFWNTKPKDFITPLNKKAPEGFNPVEMVQQILSGVDYSKVIDFGCGYGRLSKAFDSGEYIGVDLSADMIKTAQSNHPEYVYSEINENSEFPRADLFMAYTSLLHNPDKAVSGIIKRARSAGCNTFLVAEILGHEWRNPNQTLPVYNRTKEEYETLFGEFGFTLSKCKDLSYKHYAEQEKYAGKNTNISFMLFERKVKISILTPTRNRPQLVRRMIESFKENTVDLTSVELLFFVDSDDPQVETIEKIFNDGYTQGFVRYIIDEPCSRGKAWNRLAEIAYGDNLYMGNDDLVCKTKGWEESFLRWTLTFNDALYLLWADDGINGRKHAAFPMVSRKWYETLGYFVPEQFLTVYPDTWLYYIAKMIGRASFVPAVMIRHLHFTQNKNLYDDTYDRARKDGQVVADKKLFESQEMILKRREEAKKLYDKMETSLEAIKSRYSLSCPFELKEYLKGKSVAIIGPGPSLMGKKLGRFIDSVDVVCRVNECFPFDCIEDYGSRTDLIFHTLSEGTLGNFMMSFNEDFERAARIKAVICPQLEDNGTENKRQNYNSMFLKYEKPPFYSVSDDFWWSVVRASNGATPNTGTLAIMYLLLFDIKDLYIDGFDFYKKGENPKVTHYPDYLKWGGDVVKKNHSLIHDQLAQIVFFKTRIMLDKRVSFSEDTAKNLNRYVIVSPEETDINERDGTDNAFYHKILTNQAKLRRGKFKVNRARIKDLAESIHSDELTEKTAYTQNTEACRGGK